MDSDEKVIASIFGGIILFILAVVIFAMYTNYQTKVLYVTHGYQQTVVMGHSELPWQKVKEDTSKSE